MYRLVLGGLSHLDEYIKIYQELEKNDMLDKIQMIVFDAIPGSKTEGGRAHDFNLRRVNDLSDLDKDTMDRIDVLNKLGIGFNFVMTNRNITELDMKEERTNKYLRTFHNEMNGVIVSNDIVNDYIKENYPKFKRICSVTRVYSDLKGKNLLDNEYFKGLLERYDFIVAPWELSLEKAYKQLDFDLSRVEFIVMDGCEFGCKFKDAHYNFLDNVNYKNVYTKQMQHMVRTFCSTMHPKQNTFNVLSKRQIWDMLVYDIRNFKIGSRRRAFGKDILGGVIDTTHMINDLGKF